MSARNLLPVAAALAEPVVPELLPAAVERLCNRAVAAACRLRARCPL